MYNVENGFGKRSNKTNRFNLGIQIGRKGRIMRQLQSQIWLNIQNELSKGPLCDFEKGGLINRHTHPEQVIPEPDKADAPPDFNVPVFSYQTQGEIMQYLGEHSNPSTFDEEVIRNEYQAIRTLYPGLYHADPTISFEKFAEFRHKMISEDIPMYDIVIMNYPKFSTLRESDQPSLWTKAKNILNKFLKKNLRKPWNAQNKD